MVIFIMQFSKKNGEKLTLYCKIEEKLNDLFTWYKIIKGCTDKNYIFDRSMMKLDPELEVINSDIISGIVRVKESNQCIL